MEQSANHLWRIIVIVLLALGLLGHVLAAHVMASNMAYVHHVFGFFFVFAVTGAIIGGLGRWLWRDKPHITWLAIGAVQAFFGLMIYLYRFHIA